MDRPLSLIEFLQLNADWLTLGGLVLLLVVVLVLLFRLGGLREVLLRQQSEQERLEGLLREQERGLTQSLHQQQEAIVQAQQTALREQLQRQSETERRQAEEAGRLRLDLVQRFEQLQKATADALSDGRMAQQRSLQVLKDAMELGQNRHRETFEQRQAEAVKAQHESLTAGIESINRQLAEALQRSTGELGKRFDGLTQSTDSRLKEISGQVEKRLSEGFEKTTETFTRVLEHLSRIDEAQKKITELSSNVVSLQEVLTDKRSRGAFGEVQLSALVRNLLPEQAFALQHSLSNGTRVDCMLFLPEPTGNVPIDSKFPLESYQRMMDTDLPDIERQQATRQFKQDIRKHIGDIADKYLIPGETADGAVMFIPAEAIFAEIHAHYQDLVEEAQRRRVWLVSPTTLMAILTTARAVIKDEATREQVHIIQDHLRKLSGDFGRFQDRMDKLAAHIRQAHDDVDKVNISAKKITGHFEKIEQVELDELPPKALGEPAPVLDNGLYQESGSDDGFQTGSDAGDGGFEMAEAPAGQDDPYNY